MASVKASPAEPELCDCGFPFNESGVCEMAVSVIPARIEGRTAWSPELVTYSPGRPLDVTMDSEETWLAFDRRREAKPLPRMLARDRREINTGSPGLSARIDGAPAPGWKR